MRKTALHAFALAGLLALPVLDAGTAAAQVAAPSVSVTDIKNLPQPLPLPYDEEANADAEVAAAFARAKANGKRVMLNFGGDWCPDCRVLAGIMELPEVKSFLADHYELVKVDVGRMNKNLQIPAKYGVEKLRGVPTVMIITADDKVLNATNSAELSSARSMTPQSIADWLAKYAAPVKKG
ncbi:thioredoxin fold domain-containing protein [Niveispirillum sp. SYP-B3756]|uniref:thioredoxin family protein n=1 Tax=Niveispirillum sp. SYP-B3756 TaxID=2662178 RepID=UPI0012915FEA|nr:thioredoxin family protein [Niveispirillum sp. SYP-B3756]MQP65647.1 thioredoxin fold domain-containing protein [Niveispirillum sp. SYP-B3756]